MKTVKWDGIDSKVNAPAYAKKEAGSIGVGMLLGRVGLFRD